MGQHNQNNTSPGTSVRVLGRTGATVMTAGMIISTGRESPFSPIPTPC